jgi:hypothetical protein
VETDDGVDASFPIESVERSNNWDDDPDGDGVVIVSARNDYWAELKVRYTWNANGTLFSVTVLQYRAGSNGRNSGNVEMGLISKGRVDYKEITGSAKQDGQWHDLPYSLSVEGDAKVAHINFHYIYDRDDVKDIELWGNASLCFRPPAPVTASSIISSPSVTMTGTGAVDGSTIAILDKKDFSTLANATIKSGGNWEAKFNVPGGVNPITCFALQMIGLSGKRSSDVTITVVYVTLARPVEKDVVCADRLEFAGTGFPEATVWAVDADSKVLFSEQAQVGTDKSWTAKGKLLDGNVHPAEFYTADLGYQIGDSPVRYAGLRRAFTVLGALHMVPLSGEQEMNFTVTGTNGMEGATVKIRKDLGDIQLGSGTVGTGGIWSADVQLTEAGLIRLVAEQIYNGVTSPPSNYETFKIKPPKLVNIQVTYADPGTVTFSGSGYNTATVDVHIKDNVTPVGSGNVSGGTWSVDWSEQPPASHIIDIRQKVSDGQGGWIYSVWADSLAVKIPVPPPTLSAQVGADRRPVLSGTGHSWPETPQTNIEVDVSGPSGPDVPLIPVINDSWRHTAATAWAPGRYQLRARQWFGDLASGWTPEQVSLIVPAPQPTVTVLDNGLTPNFSGTCLSGATVQVWFDDDEGSAEGAQVSGTTWTYSRPEPFLPDTYTVNVKQTVNEVISAAASEVFTVVVTKPVITAPAEAQEVDHNPIIEGTGGIPGAKMTVHDDLTDLPIDNNEVTADAWSVPVSRDLPFGGHTIYAVQQYEGFDSEKSDPVSFTVILFPPIIEHPQPGESVPRKFVIDGYARQVSGLDTAQVELWLEGEDEPWKAKARGHDGYWFYEADLPVGRHVLRAKQIFAGEESELGTALDFTVVPAKPVIESPAALQHLGTTATLSGFGYAGDWVEVAWSDAAQTILGRTQVQANRTWSLALTFEKPAGEHSWIMRQVNGDYSSGWSDAHPVMVLSPAPSFTAPEPGHWFAGLPVFHGTGETGKAIELSHWFDTRQRISQGDRVEDGAWSASPDTPLPPASHWVKARQGDSAWEESARFEVDPFGQTPEG